jgi:hypothetical protein
MGDHFEGMSVDGAAVVERLKRVVGEQQCSIAYLEALVEKILAEKVAIAEELDLTRSMLSEKLATEDVENAADDDD